MPIFDSRALANLLTPIAKAFLSDKGFECAVLAQQVFGGHGYIKGWGMEQIVRDTRIASIYEGTNGVQALDFIQRKMLADGGVTLMRFVREMATDEVPGAYREPLDEALTRLAEVSEWILAQAPRNPSLPGALSTDYLELVGLTIFAWLWARMAGAASADAFGEAKRRTARFFFQKLLPKTLALACTIRAGSIAMDMPDELF